MAVRPDRLHALGAAARQNILGTSWDTAFEMTYSAYRFCQESTAATRLIGAKPVLVGPQIPVA